MTKQGDAVRLLRKIETMPSEAYKITAIMDTLATLSSVPDAPPLDVERAFIKGWFAALLYAIDDGGDPTSSEEARRQAAEYVRQQENDR